MEHHRHPKTFSTVYPIVLFVGIVLTQACSHNNIKYSAQPIPTDNNTRNIPDVWNITAKLGIRNNEDSGSVTINWQQTQDQYHIQISGPFGQGNATLLGDDNGILIERPGKEPVSSSQPNALIADTFGWNLPLKHLRYWVRGLPTPHGATSPTTPLTTYNETGLLSRLKQRGWTLHYSRYRPIAILDGRVLPHKIRAQRNDAILTLIIKEWLFPALNVVEGDTF
ncbi:MAG: outer membrane lipoprotein LolB [Candidatus Endobugula sp.]|jgi:outer membrane lipoprotein LolB